LGVIDSAGFRLTIDPWGLFVRLPGGAEPWTAGAIRWDRVKTRFWNRRGNIDEAATPVPLLTGAEASRVIADEEHDGGRILGFILRQEPFPSSRPSRTERYPKRTTGNPDASG